MNSWSMSRTFSAFTGYFMATIGCASATMLVAGGPDASSYALTGVWAAAGQSVTAQPNSILGYSFLVNGGAATTYCANDDFLAELVFDSSAGKVSQPCANGSAFYNYLPRRIPIGFNPSSSGLPQYYPNLILSSFPPSQLEYDTYEQNAGNRVEPVLIPAFAESVAIIYNHPAPAGVRFNLDPQTVCDLATTGRTPRLNLPGYPWTFVYHAEASNSTLALANHVFGSHCALSVGGLNLSDSYVSSATAPYGFLQSAPAGSIGVFGDIAVLETVLHTPYSIGYVTTGTLVGYGLGYIYRSGVRMAFVNGRDPIRDVPSAARTIRPDIAVDQHFLPVQNYPPLFPYTGVPIPRCMQLVNPKAYAYPSQGYPIIGVVNILLNRSGNEVNTPGSVALLRSLVGTLTTSASFGPGKIQTVDSATAVVGQTGYSQLPAPLYSVMNNTASTCIN